MSWGYEEEVRCVFPNNKPNERIYTYYKKTLLKMPPIKRVIVGCKADKDFVDRIKESNSSIPITKMKAVDGKYLVKEE